MIGRTAVGSTPAPTLSERWGDSLPRLPHVDAPRRPLRARVGVLETTPGGVHEPSEHCRPRSRQAHLSDPWADSAGAVVFRKKLRRGQLLAFLATLPPCTVAMEAC